MLRLRRGIGPSVTFSPIYRPHLRCPRQYPLLRSFATAASPNDASKPSLKPKSNSEDVLKRLTALSNKLEARLRKLEKGTKTTEKRKRDKKGKTAHSEIKDKKETNEADISDALAVAKRVYGIEKSKKKRKKKGPKPSSPNTEKEQHATDKVNSTESSSRVVGQQAPVWKSLQEKLQEPGAESSMHPTVPQHNSTTDSLEEDQHVISSSDNTDPDLTAQPSTKTKNSKKKKESLPVHTIEPQHLKLRPVEEESRRPVPKLAHQLDKVLFNGGPYQLQDQRTQVYNFDPYLASIMPVEEFDFDALKEYVTSSKDSRLTDLCAKYEKKYCGSTSSMTAMLSQFHFLLSAWRPLSFRHLSRSFKVEFDTFTVLTRGPAAAFARYKDGVYAIDADKEFDTANVLTMLGKSMEKLLTLPKRQFEKYRRDRSHELSEEEKTADEAFHFTTLGDFMMRSQLDAFDPRLPGTGMFDLKTRAVVSIRMDVEGYKKGVGYEIRNRFGTWESFEREYYDMIRAAFLKYSLQVRMGRMDGIFVAFHNTERIFGFQYISLEEMDVALHGTSNRRVGDEEFKVSVKLLNDLLDRAAKRFPEKSLRLHIETRPTNPPLTYFFAEPVSDKEMQETQEKGKETVALFESNMLGMSQKNKSEEKTCSVDKPGSRGEDNSRELSSAERQKSWDEMMAKVDQTVEEDAAGLDSVREAIEQALEQSGLLAGKSEHERESYLNELVEALTEELNDSKEGASELEDTFQKDSAEDESLEASRPSSNPEAVLPPSNDTPEADSSDTCVDPNNVGDAGIGISPSLSEPGGTVAKEAHGPVVGEAVDNTVAPSNGDDSADASLKDLIIKFAQGVDNQLSNLGTFERVLSELVRNQKELSGDVYEISAASSNSAPVDHKASETDEAPSAEEAQPGQESDDIPEKEILGLCVTIRNMLDGYVVRRVSGSPTDKAFNWKVEYTIKELQSDQARRILKQLKARRKKALTSTPEDRDKNWHKLWGGTLPERTEAGRKYRDSVIQREKQTGVKIAWSNFANNGVQKRKKSVRRRKESRKKGHSKNEESEVND
ncbi:hypothetical protein FBEOM_1559 [Fusarium beomiforme]|uniref:PET127 n=1 Tax=Fusarium beomiforme TaxID=44412 RepID=A0A9P5E0S3_9HYPO|nr:hypothetical protein FBEOM_1559 [Fusarium beomiforme]